MDTTRDLYNCLHQSETGGNLAVETCPRTMELLELLSTAFLTSVGCERNFSLLKRILTSLRASLKESNVNRSMIIASVLLALLLHVGMCWCSKVAAVYFLLLTPTTQHAYTVRLAQHLQTELDERKVLNAAFEQELLEDARGRFLRKKRRRLSSPNYNDNPKKQKVKQTPEALQRRKTKTKEKENITSFSIITPSEPERGPMSMPMSTASTTSAAAAPPPSNSEWFEAIMCR